jgi:hypothetical protein
LKKTASNYQSTTAVKVTAELNIYLEELASTKLSGGSFTNPKSKIKLQLLRL